MRSLPAWAYEAALLATVLVWGINFAVIKLALAELPPYVVNALRFAVSAVALGLAHWATSRPLPEAEGGDGRGRSRFWLPMQVAPWRIVGLGLLGYVGYQVSFILGVNLTTAGTAGLIIGSAPALTALFARLFGIERLSPAAWAGLAISLVGMIVVIRFGPHEAGAEAGAREMQGNLLMGLAAVLWSLYTVVSRPVMDSGASPTGAAFFGVLVALPFLFGFGLSEAGGIDWGAVSPAAWAAILFSGGLSTGLAYAVWNEAVKAVGPSHTAAFTNLVPFLAVGSGALMLGEPVTLAQVGGGALIIGGLVLMRRARQRRLAAEAATAGR